jgi:hypothetical protein
MMQSQTIKRTTSNDKDFQWLIQQLDKELWDELNEGQATYDQYNKVPDINTAVVVYVKDEPAASGCFKKYNADTVEIKRMFVTKEHRGKGLSKIILNELENWAVEEGFKFALLETSIHFIPATTLYKKSGYKIIPNYDQYAELEESVCMKKPLPAPIPIIIGRETQPDSSLESSASMNETALYHKFLNSPSGDRGYFDFEEDFIEENIRCIPMIVRFKMDAAGIKLKLAEWSKFKTDERIQLAVMPASTNEEAAAYNIYLTKLIEKYTGAKATALIIDTAPGWANLQSIPLMLSQKAHEFDLIITVEKWQGLTNLQRFTLLKLCRPGHENKNFPKAIKEFNLL